MAAVIAAPAWATCASALLLAASHDVCPMPADDHCAQTRPCARAACCLLDARMPDATVPPAVMAAPGLKAAPGAAVGPASIGAGAPEAPSLGIVARAPLRLPRSPAYLRNSILRI